MTTGVSYARIDMTGTERFVSLRQELGVTSFGMNLILLHAGARGRIHKHAKQEEVYIVLEGRLSLSIEGVERDMNIGELARVGPEVRRQLINRGPGKLAILALGGAGEHIGRDGTAYVSWNAAEGAPPQETPLPEDLPPDGLRKD
jgi:mannose-6-phosphate isomerase-like protein (cupin superfamily)